MVRIYIETTVVSFYFNARLEPEMVARQNWTRRWLDAALLTSHELVTSIALEAELNAGDFPHRSDMLELASRFPLLDINDAMAASARVTHFGLGLTSLGAGNHRWRRRRRQPGILVCEHNNRSRSGGL